MFAYFYQFAVKLLGVSLDMHNLLPELIARVRRHSLVKSELRRVKVVIEEAGRSDHYTYRVTWSEEDKEYVGLCAEFPGLSWLADSQEAVLQGIRNVVAEVIVDMQSSNEPIPQPLAPKK